ncbi:hypothetical protein FF38_04762 [Lucilia cuprina]|uniref:Uncharacterized protein n=1 Tax=Lucilia cuprina TaxID=7375 RepID=A0A0L0CQW4_LUCCU|nr:hypothetical protein FF38_04762 [Lucilia cuprina]
MDEEGLVQHLVYDCHTEEERRLRFIEGSRKIYQGDKELYVNFRCVGLISRSVQAEHTVVNEQNKAWIYPDKEEYCNGITCIRCTIQLDSKQMQGWSYGQLDTRALVIHYVKSFKGKTEDTFDPLKVPLYHFAIPNDPFGSTEYSINRSGSICRQHQQLTACLVKSHHHHHQQQHQQHHDHRPTTICSS